MPKDNGPRPMAAYNRLWDWARKAGAKVEVHRERQGAVWIMVKHQSGELTCGDDAALHSLETQAADITAQLQGAGWWA